MSDLTSNLKTWGAQGSEYQNGYSYEDDVPPVDAWDNYLTYHIIEEIQDLQGVVNDRLESDSADTFEAGQEPGQLNHRTDSPGESGHSEELYYWDGQESAAHRLLTADGDTMEGVLDMGGYQIEDSTGPLTLAGSVNAPDSLSYGGDTVATETWVNNNADVPNADHADTAGDADTLDGQEVYQLRTDFYKYTDSYSDNDHDRTTVGTYSVEGEHLYAVRAHANYTGVNSNNHTVTTWVTVTFADGSERVFTAESNEDQGAVTRDYYGLDFFDVADKIPLEVEFEAEEYSTVGSGVHEFHVLTVE